MPLVYQVRQFHWDAVLPPQVGGPPDIFCSQCSSKARLEITLEQKQRKLILESFGSASTIIDDIRQGIQVYTGLDAQCEGFRQQNSGAHAH